MTPAYFIRRLAFMLLTLLCISAIIFVVTGILPGNLAQIILGEYATPEALEAFNRKMGLDQPYYMQYFNWLKNAVQGDLGTALSMEQPISEVVAFRLKNSAMVAALSLAVVTVIAIPLGVWAALRRNSLLDRTIQLGSYIGISIPEFAAASLLIILLAGPVLSIFPSTGFVPMSESPFKLLYHMALPVATLVIVLIAHIMRQTRSEMIQIMQTDYIRSARLKGLTERKVIYKHALRNAMLPTVTVLALDVGYLIGSIVVVEEVFSFPGIGRLVVFAVHSRDIPLLQSTVLVIAAVYCLVNFLADLCYAFLNPKIRYH